MESSLLHQSWPLWTPHDVLWNDQQLRYLPNHDEQGLLNCHSWRDRHSILRRHFNLYEDRKGAWTSSSEGSGDTSRAQVIPLPREMWVPPEVDWISRIGYFGEQSCNGPHESCRSLQLAYPREPDWRVGFHRLQLISTIALSRISQP